MVLKRRFNPKGPKVRTSPGTHLRLENTHPVGERRSIRLSDLLSSFSLSTALDFSFTFL